MEVDLGQLKAFAAMQSKEKKKEEQDTLLDALWYFYMEHHPVDNEMIQARFEGLEEILQKLSQKRKYRMIRTVADLCVEHEREAYVSGLRVGARLMVEILTSAQEDKNYENVFIDTKISTLHI